jgi:hypothetical protein
MIFDGPDKFPNSTVEYTRFKHYPLRERFAKLREQEFWLQDTLKKGEIREENWSAIWTKLERSDLYVLIRTKFFLEFTEGELIWMAHNVSDEFRDEEIQAPRRRSKAKDRRQNGQKFSRQIPLFGTIKKPKFKQRREDGAAD